MLTHKLFYDCLDLFSHLISQKALQFADFGLNGCSLFGYSFLEFQLHGDHFLHLVVLILLVRVILLFLIIVALLFRELLGLDLGGNLYFSRPVLDI